MSESQNQRPPVLDYQRPMGAPAGSHRRVIVRVLLAVGLLFMAISIILPQLGAPSERANRVKCSSNLRLIGQAITLYANDFGGAYPQSLISMYTACDLNPDAFICASSSDEKDRPCPWGPTTQAVIAELGERQHMFYVYLGAGMHRSTVTPGMVIAHDRFENHEKDGMNVLYGDGHVDWHSRAEAQYILNELKAGHNPPRPQAGTMTQGAP